MNRYDIIANRGRGSVLFTKEVPTNKGKYIRFVDYEKECDKLKAQNKEMLEALIENLKESINLEVNRGTLLKTAMIHNSHEIDIIEKVTGKTIEEALK